MKRTSMRIHLPDVKKLERFDRSGSRPGKSPKKSAKLSKASKSKNVFRSEVLNHSRPKSKKNSSANVSKKFIDRRATVNFIAPQSFGRYHDQALSAQAGEELQRDQKKCEFKPQNPKPSPAARSTSAARPRPRAAR